MEKIRVLDESIANKIAAGEVVERPASVVKELVENSIDAGASRISIEITDGGMSYMRVSDNGCGMGREDAKNCFLRHATSKIHDTGDLFSIKTLGFRGEAMASIAAVARVTLKTHRPDDDFGTSVIIDGGTFKEVSPCGCPDGTAVEVSDLFYNVPARLKFMKAAKTETGYIGDFILRMILARPDISFKLINNGNVIYHSSGDGVLKNAIYSVYGADVIPHLREVKYEDEYVRINGYVGTDNLSRPNRTHQSIFVNGRYVKSLKLSAALMNAYDTRIMVGRFPFAVLAFAVDYSEVDVNVHPNKLEVRFIDEQRIASTLCHAAKCALDASAIPVYIFEKKQITEDTQSSIAAVVPEDKKSQLFEGLMAQANFDDHVSESVDNNDQSSENLSDTVQAEIPFYPAVLNNNANDKVVKSSQQVEFGVNPYEILGSVFDSFWLIRQGENLLILDQHAAHERMLYEAAMKGELKANTQILLIPIIVKLTTEEMSIYLDNVELFEEFGFNIEQFGVLTLRITAVPYVLSKTEDERFFKDAIAMLSKQKAVTLKDMKRDTLIRASCKGAIKLGNVVPQEMIKAILDEFNESGVALTCPHGRPVMIAITKNDLFKKFKRIV